MAKFVFVCLSVERKKEWIELNRVLSLNILSMLNAKRHEFDGKGRERKKEKKNSYGGGVRSGDLEFCKT